MNSTEEAHCERLTEMISEEPARLQTRIGRLIHDNNAAEDLAQEALLRAIRGVASLRGPAEEALLCKWLDRIACNVAFNHTRDQGRKPALASIDHDDALPDEAGSRGDSDPEATLTRRETEQELHELLDTLPTDLRSVFVLRDVEELSTAETSARLGIKEGLVKWRLHKARALLREQLGVMAGRMR